MIKKKYWLIILTISAIAFKRALGIPFVALIGGIPSDLRLEHPTKPIPDASFVLDEQSDFRLLFCTYEVLTNRVKRSVCVFDFAGLALNKNDGPVSTREISVAPNTTLEQVLKDAYMGKWRGGRPQIQLISRNSIIQDSIFPSGTQSENDRFLETKVSPGDFIVLAAVE